MAEKKRNIFKKMSKSLIKRGGGGWDEESEKDRI
jgi:hypothetical protein